MSTKKTCEPSDYVPDMRDDRLSTSPDLVWCFVVAIVVTAVISLAGVV